MLSEFEKQVLEAVKKIPKGRISTYKLIAQMIRRPRSPRAVGNVLNKNPEIIKIPCHRVVKSSGELGGYIKGVKEKEKLLKNEGILIKNNRIVDFEKIIYPVK